MRKRLFRVWRRNLRHIKYATNTPMCLLALPQPARVDAPPIHSEVQSTLTPSHSQTVSGTFW